MYIPGSFAETDLNRLFDLMSGHSFGTLVTVDSEVPQVTHLPFRVEPGEGEHGMLYGHFARANPHWKTLTGDKRALAIFQGPHCYVSPSWYDDHSNVPTWNYAVVHASGPAELLDDKASVLKIVSRLTEVHESGMQEPWRLENASKHMDKLLSAIVGFRIRIEHLDGKYKLSQNRTGTDRQGVIDALSGCTDSDSVGVARLMRENQP